MMQPLRLGMVHPPSAQPGGRGSLPESRREADAALARTRPPVPSTEGSITESFRLQGTARGKSRIAIGTGRRRFRSP